MSELVPFFDEDEQLDDNLLRSIETLLDDEQTMDGGSWNRGKNNPFANGMLNAPPNSPMPQYESMVDGSSFAFGNQVYQKWSTNESMPQSEMPNNIVGGNINGGYGPKRQNYNRNHNQQAKPMNNNNNNNSYNFGKAMKKAAIQSAAAGLTAMHVNAQIAQYQAVLAERANQLLTQYLQLNYESLNAQAQILGIPLDQYIRNLLVALQTQSLLLPLNHSFLCAPNNINSAAASVVPQPQQTPTTPPPMTMPNAVVQQQRAFAKQYFNSKKF